MCEYVTSFTDEATQNIEDQTLIDIRTKSCFQNYESFDMHDCMISSVKLAMISYMHDLNQSTRKSPIGPSKSKCY